MRKFSLKDFIRDYDDIINNSNSNNQEKFNNSYNRINQLEEENEDLKKQLKKKENEIKELNSNENNYINQIRNYENEIQALKKENNDLISKIKLLEKKNNKKNSDKDNNKILLSLMEKLDNKDNAINELKNSINKLGKINEKNRFDLKEGEYLMPVIFQSTDSKIHYAFISKNTDRFNIIENMLYDKYPEYLETENYFTVNGNKINKSKTMEQNQIKYSDIIILNIYDM